MADESPNEAELLELVRAAIDARPGTELVEIREILSDEVRITVTEQGREQPAVYRVVRQPDIDHGPDRFRWIYLGDST